MNMVENPEQDLLFDCLAHQHRRVIIDVLRNTNSPKTTLELAQDIVEETCESSNKKALSPESIQESLYHLHLPKLRDAGFVEYDEQNGIVAPVASTSYSGVLVDIADLITGIDCQENFKDRGWDNESVTG